MNSGNIQSDRPISGFLIPFRQVLRCLRNALYRLRLVGKEFSLGKASYISGGALLHPPVFFNVGDRVSVGRDFFLQTNLSVSNDVLISSRVSIVGNDHDFSDKNTTVYAGRRLPASTVRIGSDCLICHGVTIVGDVVISDGVIVGAGSVVTKDLPPYTICVGVPAKPIRNRYEELL